MPTFRLPAATAPAGTLHFVPEEAGEVAEAPAYLAPPSGQDLADPAVESESREPELEHDTPQLPQAISDAVERKDWPRVLELALQVGWHDENQLTNLLFFGRHPELDRRPLDPKHSAKDRTLAAESARVELVREFHWSRWPDSVRRRRRSKRSGGVGRAARTSAAWRGKGRSNSRTGATCSTTASSPR